MVKVGSNKSIQSKGFDLRFPTPGQIRSMFNTGKIAECPEYANSPSTMSDPLQWRPTDQIEVLEERLMRIRQWNDNNSFINRSYEGSVTITNINNTTENISPFNNNDETPCVSGVQSTDRVYSYSDNRCEIDDNDCETHSEMSGQSERLVDVDYNHREYDVEEYVEQINNFADISENSSRIYDECSGTVSKTMQSVVNEIAPLEPELLERQKYVEQLFNLTLKENDNEFVNELKTDLIDIVHTYFQQKDISVKCPLLDDVRKVSDMLNRAISDKDSSVCDKVHELCLRLRDIVTLKDDVIKIAMAENFKFNQVGDRKSEVCDKSTSFCSRPIEGAVETNNESSLSSIEATDKGKHCDEKVTIIHNFNKDDDSKLEGSATILKGSFESLTKFSRIPIAKSKLPKAAGVIQQKTGQKVNNNTKIPISTVRGKHINSNVKQDHIIDHRDSRGHVNKRVNPRHSRDMLQHKDDIIKKAAILGLIDGVNDVAKIPQQTERAQLALLEKQIQGKLKSKQLALERKKIGLKDRFSNMKLNHSDSAEVVQKGNSSNRVPRRMYNTETKHVLSEIHENISNNKSGQDTSIVIEDTIMISPEDSKMSVTALCDQYENDRNVSFNENLDIKVNSNNYHVSVSTNTPFIRKPNSSMEQEKLKKETHLIFEDEYMNDDDDEEDSSSRDISVLSHAPTPESAVNAKLNECDKTSTSMQLESNIGSERPRRSYFISLILTTLILITALSYFVYHKEFFELYEQLPLVMDQIWEHIQGYGLKEQLSNNIVVARKYIKKKCELL